jgi:hypothetical protein
MVSSVSSQEEELVERWGIKDGRGDKCLHAVWAHQGEHVSHIDCRHTHPE